MYHYWPTASDQRTHLPCSLVRDERHNGTRTMELMAVQHTFVERGGTAHASSTGASGWHGWHGRERRASVSDAGPENWCRTTIGGRLVTPLILLTFSPERPYGRMSAEGSHVLGRKMETGGLSDSVWAVWAWTKEVKRVNACEKSRKEMHNRIQLLLYEIMRSNINNINKIIDDWGVRN
jgi:hypothetical protein